MIFCNKPDADYFWVPTYINLCLGSKGQFWSTFVSCEVLIPHMHGDVQINEELVVGSGEEPIYEIDFIFVQCHLPTHSGEQAKP